MNINDTLFMSDVFETAYMQECRRRVTEILERHEEWVRWQSFKENLGDYRDIPKETAPIERSLELDAFLETFKII